MSPRTSLSSTRARDWRFVAEGGANLVLSHESHDGTSPFAGYVLRLRKRKRGGSALGGEADTDFNEFIIKPLLSHVVDLERVPVEREWLEDVQVALESSRSRSKARRDEDEIDLESGFAILAEDLVGGSGDPDNGQVITFELKPKWGFLPSSQLLSPSTTTSKTHFCRFCMHRYYRTRSISEHVAGYCPLDLYSRDEPRVRKAVDALFSLWEDTNGETNNFRIFVQGRRLDFREATSIDSAKNWFFDVSATPTSTSLRNEVARLLVPALLESPLLPNLSHWQSTLDPLDIEGLASSISKDCGIDIADNLTDLTRLGSQPELEEWRNHLATFESPIDPRSTRPFDVRHEVLSFLLSATFKDCSVMVRFKKVSNQKGIETTLKAIDLDAKPITKLAKWLELDQSIVETWNDMLKTLTEEERAQLRRCRM